MKLHASHLKKSIEKTDMRTGENALAEHAISSLFLRKYSFAPRPLRINRNNKIRHGTRKAAKNHTVLSHENICCRAISTQ